MPYLPPTAAIANANSVNYDIISFQKKPFLNPKPNIIEKCNRMKGIAEFSDMINV